MSGVLTFQKSERGWTAEMPPEMARAAGVVEGSYFLVYFSNGEIHTEILPPANEETIRRVNESVLKFKDAFEEMKRLGD
jgi:hypothetical protein